jgi:nucleoside-diphosphate-sugar epimerase
MVAVVTGAAGFIGQTLVRELAKHGPVLGIDRVPMPPVPGAAALAADLLEPDREVHSALHRAETVFHLAGCPSVRDPRTDVDAWRYRDNVLATAAVLAAVPFDTPLLVTSSSSVYGGAHDGRPCVETDPLAPRGGYARSKMLVEQLCAARQQAGGVTTVVRPFTVAGEGQRPGMALSVWIDAARAAEPLEVFGSLERSRDITDVRQAVRALIELAELRWSGMVNLGTGVGRTLGELVDAVARVVGVEVTVRCTAAATVEVPHTLADTTLLRKLLGWAPVTDLDALVARQAADAEPLCAAS